MADFTTGHFRDWIIKKKSQNQWAQVPLLEEYLELLDTIDLFKDKQCILRHCPACFSNDAKFLFNKFGYTIKRCNFCKSKYAHNILSKTELSNFYNTYLEIDRLKRNIKKRLNDDNFSKYCYKQISNITQYNPEKGYMLEIGFGEGVLLNTFNKNGWKTFGLECGMHNIDFVRKSFPDISVFTNEEFFSRAKNKQFDLIVFEQVLEHILSPDEMLKASVQYLKEGGILYIGAPHAQSLCNQLLGIFDGQIFPPWHINFFSQKGLEILGKRHGLKLITFKSFKGDAPLVNILSSMLNIPSISRSSCNFDIAKIREMLLCLDKLILIRCLNLIVKLFNCGSYFQAWFRNGRENSKRRGTNVKVQKTKRKKTNKKKDEKARELAEQAKRLGVDFSRIGCPSAYDV